MKVEKMSSDRAYGYFRNNSGAVGDAFHNMYNVTVEESVLDEKTHELVYIAYLAACKEYTGLSLHVKNLKKLGASRKEVESAILCGFAPVGMSLCYAYMTALEAYDDEN